MPPKKPKKPKTTPPKPGSVMGMVINFFRDKIISILILTIPGAIYGIYLKSVNSEDSIKWVKAKSNIDTAHKNINSTIRIYRFGNDKSDVTLDYFIDDKYHDNYAILNTQLSKKEISLFGSKNHDAEDEGVSLTDNNAQYKFKFAHLNERYVYTFRVKLSYKQHTDKINFAHFEVKDAQGMDGLSGITFNNYFRMHLLLFAITGYILLLIISIIIWIKRKKI